MLKKRTAPHFPVAKFHRFIYTANVEALFSDQMSVWRWIMAILNKLNAKFNVSVRIVNELTKCQLLLFIVICFSAKTDIYHRLYMAPGLCAKSNSYANAHRTQFMDKLASKCLFGRMKCFGNVLDCNSKFID